MLEYIGALIAKLFGGGTTQIGKGNQSVSNVSVTDAAGNVIVGNQGNIHLHQPQGLPATPSLSPEAIQLLESAAKDGHIYRQVYLDTGLAISAGARSVVEEDDPRSAALWDSALEELERRGCVKPTTYKRERFDVTNEGYKALDASRRPIP